MIINIILNNLPFHLWETNSDSVSFVKGALEANGFVVKVGLDQVDSEALNLFFDRFYVDPKLPIQLKTAKIRYGIVCTESISPDGVWNFGAEGEEPGVYSAFMLAAKYAEFVWCQLPESVEACRAVNSNSGQLRYGFLPSMNSIKRLPQKELDIDLLMAGLPSSRRKTILEELQNLGYNICYPGQALPVYIRDGLLARTRLNLSLQKTASHETVSVSRICHSVINRIPVLLETRDSFKNEYSRYCLKTKPEDVMKDVKEYLTETNLDDWASQQCQKMADELPMQKFMAQLIKETNLI